MEKKYSLALVKRFEIMNLLCHKVIKAKRASKELWLSIRQIRRMKKRFKENKNLTLRVRTFSLVGSNPGAYA